MSWFEVAKLDDCPPGTTLEVVAGDRIVALANVAGEIFALDGICPHQGGPLGKGALSGSTLTCPWHGWQFDVSTGRNCINARIAQSRFETKIDGGAIFVQLPDGALGQ